MAVTIYNMLNFSDSIIESLEVGNLLPGLDHFLSLNLYIKNVHAVGVLEFVEEEDICYIIAKISILGSWRDVIEAYTLENGSWRQINPKNIVINGGWKVIKTLGTYDG